MENTLGFREIVKRSFCRTRFIIVYFFNRLLLLLVSISRSLILQENFSSLRQDRKIDGDEHMRKQRNVSVRMTFTLYLLGVKKSHFVYRPVKVFFR